MFKWKKEYELGIEFIDAQHKKLFSIANAAYELLHNDLILDKYDKILDIITELKEYTEFHFSSEEQFMLERGYRKFLSHKVEHQDFIAKINEIDLKEVDFQQDSSINQLLEFIYNWIVEHILVKDKQYV